MCGGVGINGSGYLSVNVGEVNSEGEGVGVYVSVDVGESVGFTYWQHLKSYQHGYRHLTVCTSW